jgi:hypothetical protein
MLHGMVDNNVGTKRRGALSQRFYRTRKEKLGLSLSVKPMALRETYSWVDEYSHY